MFITPFLAAVLVGSFWTGVGVTAAINHDGPFFDHAHQQRNEDVVITASQPDWDSHNAACHARYRSYDGDRDMYMGFDGSWHLCRL